MSQRETRRTTQGVVRTIAASTMLAATLAGCSDLYFARRDIHLAGGRQLDCRECRGTDDRSVAALQWQHQHRVQRPEDAVGHRALSPRQSHAAGGSDVAARWISSTGADPKRDDRQSDLKLQRWPMNGAPMMRV